MRVSLLFVFTIITALCTSPCPAQEERDVPLLIVTGDATVSSAPDQALVRLGVVRQSGTADEAQKQVSSAVRKILESLRELDIDSRDLQTSQLTLFPVYSDRRPEPNRPSEPTIVGYRASNIVSATVNRLQGIGVVIDSALTAGANRIEGINFRLKNDTAARDEALTAAVAEARRKAEVMAAAAGVEIVGILEIAEQNVSVRPFSARPEAMMARAAVETPVEPGEVDVTATVTIRYRISGN